MNSSVRFLLDVNVLLSLAFSNHPMHHTASAWFHKPKPRPWASCALTQGGFLRTAGKLLGGSHTAISNALAGFEQTCLATDHEYWSVEENLMDLTERERSRLIGKGQITDMQLLMLAHNKKGLLVTMDKGIKELAKATRFEKSLFVL